LRGHTLYFSTENYALLDCYPARSRNFLPTFWDNLSVDPWRWDR